jgi:hypothetical protein
LGWWILCPINQGLYAQTQDDEFYIEALVANTSRSIVGINVVNNSDRTIQNLSFNYYFHLSARYSDNFNPDDYPMELLTREVPVSVSSLIRITDIAYYFKVTFLDGTDVRPGIENAREVYLRFNHPIYDFYHYSNQGLNLSFKKTPNITLYDGENLIWGSEPTLSDLMPTAEPAATPAATNIPGTLGDVDGNGSIDIVDALLVAQYVVGLAPSDFNFANADTNCSGSVDIVDALIIAQYYVGVVAQFC